MSEHTPTPWPEVEYYNDVGLDDESFWEFWEIPDVAKFDCEADAELARLAVNAYESMWTALRASEARVRQFEECPICLSHHPKDTPDEGVTR